ncbi:MAG: peptidase M23B family protein [Erysipelotrichaceae bacterium]|nr:MAG: peptidase M23B family [Erysipelotrichaceae bacterium]TXT19786.1 MAG: peptidase M23B family protein [Erysipelotrichaceae bacterium]
MKKIMSISFAIIMSFLLMLATESFGSNSGRITQINIKEASLVEQPVMAVNVAPHQVKKVYHENVLIGVLSSTEALDAFLKQVYIERYQTDFPDTELGLGKDIFITTETSYMTYDNVDTEIFDYLKQKDLFSVSVFKIKFSNGALIYVKDTKMFEEAKEQYLLNFVSRSAYELLKKKLLPPDLTTYGTREIGITVLETAETSVALASISEILKTKSEIIYFLSYGYNDVLKTYTVKTYDTIEYIAYQTGMSAQQLVSINSDLLQSENQILVPGTVLNVSYFDSPLSVVVTKERFAKEIVYPEVTQYVKDDSIREGLSVIRTREKPGSKNVKYIEKYVNGILVESIISSSIITKQPIREVVLVGTKIIPHIGSGTLRWPIGYPRVITCQFRCYFEFGAWHSGLDMKYTAVRDGQIYAADRGRVFEAGYNSSAGYYVKINHNNGMITYYAHLKYRSWVVAGIVVNKGEVIGTIGNTGRSTGTHLHFGVMVNGTYVNPCKYLYC